MTGGLFRDPFGLRFTASLQPRGRPRPLFKVSVDPESGIGSAINAAIGVSGTSTITPSGFGGDLRTRFRVAGILTDAGDGPPPRPQVAHTDMIVSFLYAEKIIWAGERARRLDDRGEDSDDEPSL